MTADFHTQHLPVLIKQHGTIVKRQDIIQYCAAKKVPIPTDIGRHKIRHGVYNLAPFLEGAVIKEVVASAARTPGEIEEEINENFAVMDMVTEGIIDGESLAMIASGDPGIGKTWNIEYLLEAAADAGKIEYTKVQGYSRATGLFKLLYEMRNDNQVLLVDDCDSIFKDVNGLNILKGALDTTKVRNISWRSEHILFSDSGEVLPKSFDYRGRCIFITNVDFQHEIDREKSISDHLRALMSRCIYIDLNLRTNERRMIRVKSVVRDSELLSGSGLTEQEQTEIMRYMEEHAPALRELSLRTIVKLISIMKMASGNIRKFRLLSNGTVLRKG